ncbi:hypothetical protein SLAV_38035 [Streptomyces lavendulae subsp. lavendulae]|uniref:Uncharacterized protein n=1 Tax=Streptomyces lavendulae subsp. lavendulae TaxID=58340 RepID=A0A2K8PRK2_STRLA|nr:hypothetical protein [Streptomyces lavendulae]ATZ29371.1 hypothetical protein SLAV_38035 [Streptomyces lavendulae subsp. lavendulae]QUQ59181.1 hypothetical protein SLLC_36175 [Streptomyces lavendulae subsp. lavendulae]
MEPVSVALLGALAGGAGGEAGRQAWAGLTNLVRRPFAGRSASAPAASNGEVELVRLMQDPANRERAHALSTTLAVRAALDGDFTAALQEWHSRAQTLQVHTGSPVNNTVSGGTFHGPQFMGRDFHGFTLNAAASLGADTEMPVADDVSTDEPSTQG